MVAQLRAPRRFGIAKRASSALVALCLVAGAALAHPLHTTLAELTQDPATRTLGVSLRVFADDFSKDVARTSVGRAGAGIPADSAMFRYVRERFAVLSLNGQPVPLVWCGVRRVQETLFLCLRSATPFQISGAKVRSALLSEVFPDQVNMVQANLTARRRMLLFTNRDGAKSLD